MERVVSGRTETHHQPQQIFGTFLLDGNEYAIEMADLQEVVNVPTALQVMPLSPKYLLGLYNLRGQVLPVIDLNVLLGSREQSSADVTGKRLAILKNGSARLGLLFDAAGEVLRVPDDEIAPIEQGNVSADVPRMPVKAVICRDNGDRLIQVLDLSAILCIRNLPMINQHVGAQDANRHFTARMQDLYREKLIGFSVGDCVLALEMKCVVAILESKAKTPSPRTSELCDSVIKVHGRAVPVIHMRKLLRIPASNQACRHILVCRVGNTHVGLEVDETTSIIPYAKEKVLPVPVLGEHRAGIFRGCFTDRDGRDFIVLNEEGILSREEIVSISLDHRKLMQQAEEEERARAAVVRVPLLTFKIGKIYGIRLHDVLEVMDCPAELVRTPDTPASVLGVLNLRGTPVSVVDPRTLFHIDLNGGTETRYLLVFQHQSRKIAMRVDSIESIVQVSTGTEDNLPSIFFQDDKPRLEEMFERGVHFSEKGEKHSVLVLGAEQVVKRLSEALQAPVAC